MYQYNSFEAIMDDNKIILSMAGYYTFLRTSVGDAYSNHITRLWFILKLNWADLSYSCRDASALKPSVTMTS